MLPTFNGEPIFGTACHVRYEPHAIALQNDGYPGINGLVSLSGGTRGRSFHVSGVLFEADLIDLAADQAILDDFATGQIGTFTDSYGVSWPNVLFTGRVEYAPEGPQPTSIAGGGWCLKYSVTLLGLS